MAGQSPDILHPLTSLEWEEWPSLPVGISDAHVVCMNGTVFVGGGLTRGTVDVPRRDDARLYSFRPGVDSTWTVTDTPTHRYALIEHESQLLLVGGYEYPLGQLTNKVFTLRDGEFVETLPPMREKRYSLSAVSSGSELVVAGGWGTSEMLSSVEVFRDGRWTTGPSLPTAGGGMKSALHGDMWYLIQRNGKVFCISIHSRLSKEDQSPWETLPAIPNPNSAAAFFGGHLLSIGGRGYRYTTSSIHAFSTSSQSWEHVADLPVPLRESIAGVLPNGELIVVGGVDRKGSSSDKVFQAFIKVPLVDPDVHFSLPKLFQLHRYGVNLIEALSRDRYRFHVTACVQLLKNDRQKAPTLSSEGYIELIFKTWERSKRPTYPPTWEGLFTVLRKMDLGHLVEQIAKCVTGSVPEIEDSPQTSEPEGPAGEKEVIEEVDTSDLRAEVKQLIAENDTLTEDNDLLTDENEHLTKVNEQLRAEIDLLRAKSQSWSPQIKQEPIPVKDEPESGEIYQVSTSAAHQPTAVKSEPQESLEIPYLPGVEVVGHTSVVVTNSGQSFYWSGYGFKLHSPQGSLPSDVDRCVLHIYASLAGQYQLPDNVVLVSAVFWVRCDPPCRFKQKLTLEIQHCGIINASTKFTFVQASSGGHDQSKYTFSKMENPSSFTEHSSYGSVELDHFCGVGVGAEGSVENTYCYNVFYHGKEPRRKKIHFVVMRNIDVYTTMVTNHYDRLGAVGEDPQPIAFQSDSITLDIPKEGVQAEGGWRIQPLANPAVMKSDVDSHIPEKNPVFPRCQLGAKCPGKKKKVPHLTYSMNVNGAKEPFSYFIIDMDPYMIISPPVPRAPSTSTDGEGSSLSSGQFSRAIVSAYRDHRQERRLAPPIITELHQDPHQQQHDTQGHTSALVKVSPYPVIPPPHHTGYYPPFYGLPPSHPPPSWSMQGPSGSGVSGDVLMSMPGPSSLTQGPLSSPIESSPVTFDQLVEHVGVNKDLLDRECSDEHLREIAALLHNWLKYAKLLGLKGHQIRDIDSNKHLDSEMKAQEVLRLWKKANAFKATYSSLVKVCLRQGDTDVAETICEIMKSLEDSPRPPPTGEKRRQEDEHTEEEQVPPKRPRPEV